MKRFLAGLVVGVVLSTVSVGFAEVGPIRLFVNNVEITLPDAQPVVIENRVMVPLMAFGQVTGMSTFWDQANNAVRVSTPPTPAQVEKSEPPVTLTVDGVVYYEWRRLLDLLKEKYPGVSVGVQGEQVVIGSARYNTPVQVWETRASYLDATSLLEAGVLTQEELDAAYRM